MFKLATLQYFQKKTPCNSQDLMKNGSENIERKIKKKNYVKGKNEIKCIKPVNLFAKHYSHALNSVNQTIATIFV